MVSLNPTVATDWAARVAWWEFENYTMIDVAVQRYGKYVVGYELLVVQYISKSRPFLALLVTAALALGPSTALR